MKTTFQITFTRDQCCGGLVAGSTMDGEYYGTHGWDVEFESDFLTDWEDTLRSLMLVPEPVREAGLGWSEAEITPTGYSEGAGHSLHGIQVTWQWGGPR